jgi:hypothetical protein
MFTRLRSLAASLRSRFAVARSKCHMRRNRLRQYVMLQRDGWIPKLVLDERYEDQVVWGSRIVTLLGIVANLLLIPPPINIAIALGLTTLDVFFERVSLMVKSIVVQPLPEKWDSDSWQGNLYQYDSRMWGVGLLFADEEMARIALETVRAWNYDEDVDHDGNIKMSFIEMNDGGYMTYLYPSDERETVKRAAEQVEREQIKKGKIRDHYQNTFQVIIAQDFDNPPGSNFRTFKQYYEGGRVMLNTFTSDRIKDKASGPTDGLPEGFGGVDEVDPVSLKEVNIAHVSELSPNSIEYQHLKYIDPLLDD